MIKTAIHIQRAATQTDKMVLGTIGCIVFDQVAMDLNMMTAQFHMSDAEATVYDDIVIEGKHAQRVVFRVCKS